MTTFNYRLIRRSLGLSGVLLACMVPLTGCGGGVGGLLGIPGLKQPKTVPATFDIAWAGRSRALSGPSSALSATLTLKSADVNSGDIVYTVNRDPAPQAYTKTYTLPTGAQVGVNLGLSVRFYAQQNGYGSIVGTADETVKINNDGTGIGDIAVSGTVTSVAITPGQTLRAGQQIDVLYTAKDVGGNAVSLSPGAVFLAITDGGDKAQIGSDGKLNGLAPGTVTLTATVDGKTSAPATITVAAAP